MATVGTYTIADLMAIKFQSVKAFGLNTIQEVVARELALHNELVTDMVSSLCEVTTDAQRIYGTSLDGTMVKVDEFGRAPSAKQDFGDTVGFPLERFQYALGWTQDWFEKKTPADLAMAIRNAEMAHKRELVAQIKKALFFSSNYTIRDYLVDYVALGVKRLANADGGKIPNGPYGVTFDGSTHTHYLAAASLDATALRSLISTIMEHGYGADLKVAFNYADEATVRAVTGFIPYLDGRIITPASTRDVLNQSLNTQDIYDRAIGIFEGAEIIIKPWVPQGYAFASAYGEAGKPLCFRQQGATTLQGLRIPATYEAFPLHAEYMQAEFGVGVWTRTNGACLRFTNASYADPTINS